MTKILIVEDDRDLNKTICSYLMRNGFETIGCLDADDAYDKIYDHHFDLIISDIMMPNVDGFEFVETIRGINQGIPILFMSARDDIFSKQRGYLLGIDDYMVKPINLDELLLKIGALLRRTKISSSKQLTVGNLTLNLEERTAVLKNEEIPMTVREFNLLYKLLSHPKKTFTRSQLMNEFWDADTMSSSRTVDVYITKLRDKFSACDDFEIVTVHGLGYKAVLRNG
ncbi:MAG: response regulator transcription factor [Bacilli bacterium]|nr:response regulator transcription factor [Bacilli bacterium]